VPRFGATLALWMVLVAGLNGVLWITGFRVRALAEAVEQGAARVESRRIGEVSDDDVREAIRTQHESLPFWTALAMIGDFVGEPVMLALRAMLVATAFSALAALAGRPARFDAALAQCVGVQGLWVVGLAVQVTLMVVLRSPEVETSLALLLPPGTHSAAAWVALRQLTPFALLGWAALAWGGWRRRQVGLTAAVLVCILLAIAEAALRINVALVLGAGMRLTLIPESP